MRYLTYQTDNCSSTAQKYSLSDQVSRLLKKIEDDQSVQAWDSFLPSPFIKKNLGKHFRLIASKHFIEDKDLVVISFLVCLPHAGEYSEFLNNPASVGQRYLPPQDMVRSIVEERTKLLPSLLPNCSSTESDYLFPAFEDDRGQDITIYESPDWVEALRRNDILDLSTWLCDMLRDIVGGSTQAGDGVKQINKNGISILYRPFGGQTSIYLLIPFLTKNGEPDGIRERYRSITEPLELPNDAILRHSRRAYPSLVLADELLWKAIERSEVGNIALSPEESQVLNEVILRTGDRAFPLFINGRPGSGKSTILQYLFASQLGVYALQKNGSRLQYPPLYLTYSERLLDLARSNVEAILKCNPKFALGKSDLTSLLGDLEIKKCFKVFQEFLLELLPDSKRQEFQPGLRIDFSKFRQRWDEHRKKHHLTEVRKLTPELTWHVIRSFIKGMRYDAESDFTVESYLDLPKKQQTVQYSTFELVYEHVWDKWYRPLCESGYWDDQDLVFSVLNEPAKDLSKYPAVFCDEAQDFSKLELDLILRLSLYSRRNMSPHELKLVPFAFAGDPFQTLNPTGFQWESLQAYFHEKIVSGLDKSARGKLEFNYQELSHNYRSGKFIVGLCNLIQLMRGVLFDQKHLKPQQTWFDSESGMPLLYNIKDPSCTTKLRDQTEMIIILPCQEGEEEEYVKADEFLSSLPGPSMRNFLSPLRAKGLEFSMVILYKFGNACYQQYPQLLEPLQTGIAHSDEKDTSLPYKYFLNRLYVGASRAKNRLIIVDDDKGIETLWKNEALESKNLLKMYKQSGEYGWKEDTLNYVIEGDERSWTQDRDDPRALAKYFHDAGLAEQDSYKLKLAEANYQRCGQLENARLSRAEWLEMEGNYIESGRLYQELAKKPQAAKCFWQAGEFKSLAENSFFKDTIEQRASAILLHEPTPTGSLGFLEFLLKQMMSGNSLTSVSSLQWQKVLDRCLDTLLTNKDGINGNVSKAYSLIIQIEEQGLTPSDTLKFADLAYRAKKYAHAVRLWEIGKSKFAENRDYWHAKSMILTYPDNIEWLEKTGDRKGIVDQWVTNVDSPLPNSVVNTVLDALLEENRCAETVTLLKRYPEIQFLEEGYTKLGEQGHPAYQKLIGQLLVKKLLANREWKRLGQMFDPEPQKIEVLKANSQSLVEEMLSPSSRLSIVGERAVAPILRAIFISRPWETVVSMRSAGAAIEKGRVKKDAIEFYERVWISRQIPAQKEDKDYAIKRWAKAKVQWAELEQKQGHDEFAARQRSEASEVCQKQLGINVDTIPDAPELIPTGGKEPSPTTPQLMEAILAIYKLGKRPVEIADFLSIGLSIVEDVIREHQDKPEVSNR